MKKLYMVLVLLSPSLTHAACPDKVAHCKEGGTILINQKWNWGKARCEPCQSGCGSTYGGAQAFCSGQNPIGISRGGISEIVDLALKPVLDMQDQIRLTAAKKKIEEEKKKTDPSVTSAPHHDEKKYNNCMERHQWRKYGYDDYHELEDKCMKEAAG